MKNNVFIWMIVILGIAFLSSCTESTTIRLEKKTDNKYAYQNHKYLQFNVGSSRNIVHDPACQELDVLNILNTVDSLSRTREWISVNCTATVYYAKSGSLTYSGDRVPENYHKDSIKWIALSKDLLRLYPIDSEVHISGISPEVDGKFLVKDKTNDRHRKLVDILVKEGELAGVWKIKLNKY